jgi:hypothetical protein
VEAKVRSLLTIAEATVTCPVVKVLKVDLVVVRTLNCHRSKKMAKVVGLVTVVRAVEVTIVMVEGFLRVKEG